MTIEVKGECNMVPFKTSPSFSKAQRPVLYWVLKYQICLALLLVTGIALVHNLSISSRPHTRKFFLLSYASAKDQDQIYTQGIDDIYFVFGWIVSLTALRAITVEWLLQPLARILGVAKRSHLRFAEQGWIFLYYSSIWTLGMFLWYNSVYWLNHAEIWTSWPSREMSGTFKWYYLIQLSFTAQLLLAIHMEVRRKDYTEMLTHHIITFSLISITYVYRYTRAANVVLCIMDFVDILLPFAKILRYLRYETACNIAFGVFVVSWFITRHVIFLHFSWSIYKHVPGNHTMLFGCYDGVTDQRIESMPAQPDYFSHLLWPFQDLDGVICLNSEVKYIFLAMLFLLHTLSSIWFVMILRVIARILSGRSAEDIRSDDESEQHTQLSIDDLNPCTGARSEVAGQAIGTSVVAVALANGLEDLDQKMRINEEGRGALMASPALSRTPRPTTVKRKLIGTQSRKDLLSRIGCEKQA